LTAAVLGHLFAGDLDDPVRFLPLCWLLASCAAHREIAGDEISKRVAAMASSTDHATSMNGLRLTIWAPYGITWFGENGPQLPRESSLARFWREHRNDSVRTYADMIVTAARDDPGMRDTALWAGLITVDQALEMPGGLLALLQAHPTGIFGGRWGGDLMSAVRNLAHGRTDLFYPGNPDPASTTIGKFYAVGRYLSRNPQPPWINGKADVWPSFFTIRPQGHSAPSTHLSPAAYLGAAATLLLAAESTAEKSLPGVGAEWFGPLSELYPYIARRWHASNSTKLSSLPVPTEFEQLFRDWADNRVNFAN